MRLQTPEKIRDLQRGLYLKAKREPRFRFYVLHDKVWREDILRHAYRLVRSNGGAPGIDGVTFQSIEEGEGEALFLSKLVQELKDKTYQPQAVRRVYIPKGDGKMRPLGIPTIRDRVAQMAVKMVIEPIFEADFEECSYGFRPKRDAHQAVGAIREALGNGHPYVYDADLSQYFDTMALHRADRPRGARPFPAQQATGLGGPSHHRPSHLEMDQGVAQGGSGGRGRAGEAAHHGGKEGQAWHATGGSDLSTTCQYLLAPI